MLTVKQIYSCTNFATFHVPSVLVKSHYFSMPQIPHMQIVKAYQG